MKVVKVTHHHGSTFLKTKIDGDYDKKAAPDPLFLDFYFFLSREKIATLMIIRDSVKSATPKRKYRQVRRFKKYRRAGLKHADMEAEDLTAPITGS